MKRIILGAAIAIWFAGFLKMEAPFQSYNRMVGGSLSLSDEVLQAIFCSLWPITGGSVHPDVTSTNIRKRREGS